MVEILMFGDVQQAQILSKDLRWQVSLKHLNEYRFPETEETAKRFGASSDRGVEVFRRGHLPQDVAEDLER